jgi:putative FmdB family regulatory protein
MPLFEFTCTSCGQNFEELLRSSLIIDGVTCPICKGTEVKKKVSTFASKMTGGNSLSFNSSVGCNTGGG